MARGLVVGRKCVPHLGPGIDVTTCRRIRGLFQGIRPKGLGIGHRVLERAAVSGNRPERHGQGIGVWPIDQVSPWDGSRVTGRKEQVFAPFSLIIARRSDVCDGRLPHIDNAAEVQGFFRGGRHIQNNRAIFGVQKNRHIGHVVVRREEPVPRDERLRHIDDVLVAGVEILHALEKRLHADRRQAPDDSLRAPLKRELVLKRLARRLTPCRK
jgi:hypothetical protein